MDLDDDNDDDDTVNDQQQFDEEVQYLYFWKILYILLQEAEAVLKSGLKHVPCKEDDEFMAEYEKMMNDSQQVGRWQAVIKPQWSSG